MNIEKSTEISYAPPYHQFIFKEYFNTANLYHKFLNWVSGEFDLCLKEEELNGLLVFYPNGKFTIQNVAKSKDNIIVEITVKNKMSAVGLEIVGKITSISKQLNNTSHN